VFRKLIFGTTVLFLGVLVAPLVMPQTASAFEQDYKMRATLTNQPTDASKVEVNAHRDSSISPKDFKFQWKGSFWETDLLLATNPDSCSSDQTACTWTVTVKDIAANKIIGSSGPTLVRGTTTTGNIAKTWNITVPPLGAAPTTGSVTGRLTFTDYVAEPDITDLPVPSNVPITITQTTGGSYSAQTSATGCSNTQIKAKDPNCGKFSFLNVPSGTYTLTAKGGWVDGSKTVAIDISKTGITVAAGEASPVNVSAPAPTTAPVDITTEDNVCSQPNGDLGWIVCPMSTMMIEASSWLDEKIISLLTINTESIFASGDASIYDKQSSAAFHKAWSIFRNIAYALLVIVGLIMILSQILGLDIFDAYTIRKMLPKLVVAAVFIPLLWPLLNLVFNMSNDAATAIMELIKAPFQELARSQTIGDTILQGAPVAAIMGGIVALLVVGFLGGWGVIGALVLSAVLVVLSAFFILMARDIVAYILIIASPVAVICGAFEPFKKLFTLWRGLLLTILLSVPAIGAVLAASKVAAVIALLTHEDIGYILALIFILAGYALFWSVFKQLDKVSGQLGNIVSKVTGGAQKALSQYRGNTLKRNFGLWKQGGLENRFGQATRGIGIRVGTAQAVSEGTGTGTLRALRGKHKIVEQGISTQTAAAMIKRDDGKTSGNDDAHEAIATAGIGSRNIKFAEARRFLIQRKLLQGKTQAQAETEATKELQEVESSFGGTIGSRPLATASAMALFESNTSLRKEKWGRTAKEGVEAGRKIMQNLQLQGAFDNTAAAKIYTANKARERAWAGFAGAMGFLAPGSDKSASQFIRDGITGNAPGSTIGQRWEGVAAVAPELREFLTEIGSSNSATRILGPQKAREIRERATQEALRSGALPNEAVLRGEDALLTATRDQRRTEFIDQMANFDAMYRYTPGVSQQSRDFLRQEVASQEFTFDGQTMTGEQWTRFLQSPNAPPDLVQRYSELLYNYTRQYQGSNLTPAQIAAEQARIATEGNVQPPGGGLPPARR
jgi:hypothetical protein